MDTTVAQQAHLRSSLQSKFAAANEEPATHEELWQSRETPKANLPVTVLPLPTDIAILRRYAAEAEKQELRGHIGQVYASAKVLTLAVIALALSLLIVVIGVPAKWALNILDKISSQQRALLATLKSGATGARAQTLLAYVEAVALYLLELAERWTGRKGLADRARQTAAHKKEQLTQTVTELETEVHKKKAELLNTIESSKKELRQREAGVATVLCTARTQIAQRLRHAFTETTTVISPLRSGLQIRRRVNEFIAVANILAQAAFAIAAILLLLPRNILGAALGRHAAQQASIASSTTPLHKTE